MKVSVCAGLPARLAPEVLPRSSIVVGPLRRTARPPLTFFPLVLAAGLLLAGCIDGSLAQRDDARHATPLGNPAESILYRARVNAETRRLLAENPNLSREAAIKQAQTSAQAFELAANTRAEQEERRRRQRAAAQAAFERELAELDWR